MNAIGRAAECIGSGGDSFDFDSFFEMHYARIARTIARVVRDPARAEELAVDVFWKLWRNPPERNQNPAGWVYRAAVRKGLDELRRQSRRERFERLFDYSGNTATQAAPHEISVERGEEQRQVRRVLAGLNTRAGELLLLRAGGLSYDEIAAALQLNPASVGTLLSRAQKAFRKEFVKRYGEPGYGR